MPVTINDVAKRLQLSVTTVSRALAGYDDVAHETRLRVIQAAREMGYVPKRAARQLRLQRAETLGLIFPTLGARFSDPFFSEFMAGVGDGASQHSYDLLVSVAPPGEAEQQTYQLWAHSGRVDGFILVRMRIEDWRVAFLTEQAIPFVAFGRTETHANAPHIGVDGRAGILDLMRHLISLGHRRIAFISAPEALTFATERLQGYRQGLEEAGLTWDPSWLAQGDLTRQGGYQTALRLLDLEPRPTAIVGVNDLTALGAIRAVQERGLRVGHDIAVAGFDGTEASEHSHPPLTTLYQPVYDIGRRCCQMLLEIIVQGHASKPDSLIRPNLIVRESTSPSGNDKGRPAFKDAARPLREETPH